MNARTVLMTLTLVGAASAARCPQSQEQEPKTPNASQPAAPGQPAQQESATARIARLEKEARALARTEGCTSADQCRSAPVGERACGGPRDYIVYCARTTDSAALYRKLGELKQAEIENNKTTGAMSTCEFRMPPRTGLSGGQCRAMP
jgi:hypothetical protein